MKFRNLRIAFSAACLIACVLLIGLWVRSYWWSDGVMGSISSTKTLVIGSGSGRFSVRVDDSTQPHRYSGRWRFDHTSLAAVEKSFKELGTTVSFRFPIFGFSGDDFFFAHWFVIIPVAVLGLISSRPWLRWQFSLRTLLIATTLVAVVLGLIVWSVRR
jgi:hypothetical protein